MSCSSRFYFYSQIGWVRVRAITMINMDMIDGDLLFWAAVVAFITLRLVTTAEDKAAAALALAAAGMALVLIWRWQQDRASALNDVKAQLGAVEASGAQGTSVARMGHKVGPDAALYTLRNYAPSPERPLRAIAARPAVSRALLRVLPTVLKRSRGQAWRVAVALEDFYERVDSLLQWAPPRGAGSGRAAAIARSIQTLLDTRAEALNTLAALEWTRPDAAHRRRVRGAIRTLLADTASALQAVADRHSTRSPEVQAADWRAPRALDPKSDPHYHLYL